MYLFPTTEEINDLWRKINPTVQIMDFIYSRAPAEGSMAEFFLMGEDVDLVMEDDAMPYFDEIEDDIINMRRDINGFLPYSRGTDSVNFKGKTIETPVFNIDLGKKVEWDEI